MLIKKVFCQVIIVISILQPYHCLAGIEKLIKNVMPSGTMSNVSRSAIVNDQLSGHMVGGSVMMKTPAMDDLQLMNFQAPSCKLGVPCGAQLDLRGGAFSFIKAAQLETFFKELATNVGGYAALMAIKTVCPQCENIMTYLEQIQRSVNQFNINSCDTATAIAGGIASKMSRGAELTKQSANVLSNRGSDMADIRAKSKDDNGDPTMGHPELKSLLGDNYNLVWKALENNAEGHSATPIKKMLMSISGTIIGRKDAENRRSVTLKKSLITNELIEDFIGSGGVHHDVELYTCDESTKCLNPTKEKTRIDSKNTIKASIDELLASMIEKIKKNNGAFSAEEENLIALSSIPLINKIQRELAWGGDGAKLTVRVEDFLQVLSYDIVTNHLTRLLHKISEAVAELSSTQIVETKVFTQFENEISSTLRTLVNNRENAYRRYNMIEQIKARMAMEESEFERNFANLVQQNSSK